MGGASDDVYIGAMCLFTFFLRPIVALSSDIFLSPDRMSERCYIGR